MLATWLIPSNIDSRLIALYGFLGGLGGLLLLVIGVYGWNLFRAPYRQRDEAIIEKDHVRQEKEREIADLQRQIATTNNTSPNVEYETVDSLPFQGAYYVRLVFRNNVVYPSGHISTSQSTKARITIFQTNGLSLDSWDGRWSENDWPTSYGDIPEKNERDIIAGDPAILDIGGRIDGQVQFKGHYNRRPESPEPPRKLLNPDSYYVLVEIWAANMGARESWFTLQIPNIPQSNDAEQVKITPTMKPVFGKVDSQS